MTKDLTRTPVLRVKSKKPIHLTLISDPFWWQEHWIEGQSHWCRATGKILTDDKPQCPACSAYRPKLRTGWFVQSGQGGIAWLQATGAFAAGFGIKIAVSRGPLGLVLQRCMHGEEPSRQIGTIEAARLLARLFRFPEPVSKELTRACVELNEASDRRYDWLTKRNEAGFDQLA